MKKITLIISFLFFLQTPGVCNTFDFRKVNWGMTRVEVAASEEMKPLFVSAIYISYKFKIFNEDVFLLYEFIENSLLSSRYVFEKPTFELKKRILEALKVKYGEPLKKDGIYTWDLKSVKIVLEDGSDLFRITYKSKKVEKQKRDFYEKNNTDEEKFLHSVF